LYLTKHLPKNIPDYDFEYSELLLYYIRILEELEQYQEALQVLDVNAKSRSIVDKTRIMHLRGKSIKSISWLSFLRFTLQARILSKVGQVEEAEEGWTALIESNPENNAWYRGYLKNRGIDLGIGEYPVTISQLNASSRPDNLNSETSKQALEKFSKFESLLPKANTPKRIALDLSSGEEFRTRVDAYIRVGLDRGIPSLFADVKSLYKDQEKRQVIGEVVEAFKKSVEPTEAQSSEGGVAF
jgi:N-alpha-acetyltransferase 15/16, NatA auxiliary subunit